MKRLRIVTPGTVGTHVHAIAGGSNFGISSSYADMLQSSCTTAPVTVDKSNYWIPQLYYYKPDTAEYTMVPVAYMNAYYLNRPGTHPNDTVSAFPDGLRMLSGNPEARSFDPSYPYSHAISYVCLDFATSHTGDAAWNQRNDFFAHNCPSGMRAQVNFPPCWDGVNLDSEDHQSHMAWPSGGVDGGDCPASHPVHLVSLFYEFVFSVENMPFNDASLPTWVWSNGDTTGYSLHGDFMNGWPSLVNGRNVLQDAIDHCGTDLGVGGYLSQCPALAPYVDSAAAYACRPQNPMVNEAIGDGSYISTLPGDNLLWNGHGIKPLTPNFTDDAITYTTSLSIIPNGYANVGCIAEGTSGRALTGASFAAANMTRGACVSFCQSYGYPLAGVEFGRECYCDSAMKNGATNLTLLKSDKCGMACANSIYENCGGSGTLQLFNNPSMYVVPTLPTGWVSTGCMTDSGFTRALSGYSFSSGAMTNELCMATCLKQGYHLAGVEFSRECYCADAFTTGSVAASSATCNMNCAGE